MFDQHIQPGAQLEIPWGGAHSEVEEVGIEGEKEKGEELRSVCPNAHHDPHKLQVLAGGNGVSVNSGSHRQA